MSDVPVLLLDIDGVLNALSKQAPTHVWKASDWNRARIAAFDGAQYPFLWATPVVEWLTGLHESGDVEIRFHTTWQHDALKVAEVLGLPVFKVQDCPEWARACANGSELAADLIRACMPPWWKYPAAERVVTDEGRRLIWIDDDIDYQIGKGARDQLKSIYMLKLVCPNQGTGIIPRHMQVVNEAIARWKENPGGALSGS